MNFRRAENGIAIHLHPRQSRLEAGQGRGCRDRRGCAGANPLVKVGQGTALRRLEREAAERQTRANK
jgi:hypothetical protein